MMSRKTPTRPTVLLVSHADQFLEVFTSPGVDVRLSRMPWVENTPSQVLAEELMLADLPRRYAALYRADALRLQGNTRPLLPSVLAQAKATQQWLDVLGHVEAKLSKPSPEDVRTWVL